MYNHTPEQYLNPFKSLVERTSLDKIASAVADIFYEDETITAFIASSTEPANQGNALVIPNIAYENLYDIPDEVLAHIHVFSKRVAIAMKEIYDCDGVSIRQHNEPAGDQQVWHYHLHVVPRYVNDNLYLNYGHKNDSDPTVRQAYAEKLRNYFNQ